MNLNMMMDNQNEEGEAKFQEYKSRLESRMDVIEDNEGSYEQSGRSYYKKSYADE